MREWYTLLRDDGADVVTLYRAVAKSSADGSRPVVVRRHQIDDGVDRAARRRRARLQHGLE